MNARLRFAGRRVDPTAAAAASLGVATIILRLPRALGAGLWQDEVASARILREPSIPHVLGHVARTESTPPLWYVLGWLAHRSGVPIVDVRLLSALFDGLLVAAVVVLARRLLPLWPSVAAGALVALGAYFSFAGRELRAYALLALVSVLFALALDSARLPALAAVTCAGTLTHYFFVLTVAAGLVWLWLEPTRRPVRRRATVAVGAGLAAAVPWLPWALGQYRHDRYSWIGPFNARVVVDTPLRLFTPYGLGAIGVALLAVGAWRLCSSATGRLVTALALGPWLLASLLWLAGVRIYAQRNLVEMGAFVAIAAVAAVPRRAEALLAAAVTASYVLLQLQPQVPYQRIASTLVAEGWRPSDPVLVFGSPYAFRSPLEWYLPRGPRLGVMAPASQRCRVAFVVGGRSAARILGDDLLRHRHISGFVVGRARLDEPLTRASLLATPTARGRCLRRSVPA